MPEKRKPLAAHWASIDPANKSGVALWQGSELVKVSRLQPVGASGKYRWFVHDGEQIDYPNKLTAWQAVCNRSVGGVVVEQGMGRFSSAINAQALLRGYINACCDMYSRPFVEVVVSEWRRVMREDHGVSFPKGSKGCKALSKKLVLEIYGLDVTDDEADAILLGRAALRMRLLPWM